MDRDKAARLLAELAKVGDVGKCRTCHCYVDVLRQVHEDILYRDLADLPGEAGPPCEPGDRGGGGFRSGVRRDYATRHGCRASGSRRETFFMP